MVITQNLKNDIKYCKVVGTLFKRLESEGWTAKQKLSENIEEIYFSIFSTFNPLTLFMSIIKHKPSAWQAEQQFCILQICFNLRNYKDFDYTNCSKLFSIYGIKKEILGGLINDNDSLFDKHTLKHALPEKDILWYVMNTSMSTELIYSLYKKITKISYKEYNKIYDMLSLTSPIHRGHKTYSLVKLLDALDNYDLKKEIELWKRMKYQKGFTSELRGRLLSRMAVHLLNKNNINYSLISSLLLKDGTSEAYRQVYHEIKKYFNVEVEYKDGKVQITITKPISKFLKMREELKKVYKILSKKKSCLPDITYDSIKMKG